MTTLEKIAKIKKVEVKNPLIQDEDLIVFTTICNKVVVSVKEIDSEGENWNTRIFNI